MAKSWFEDRRSTYKSKSDLLMRESRNISLLRILSFMAFVALAILAIYVRNMQLLILGSLGFIIYFGLVIKYHNRISSKQRHFDILARLNKDELKRLDLDLEGLDQGLKYADTQHAYSSDLDLFGPHSLFQWLNRTVTPGGEALLVESMLKRASRENILNRQQAVQELQKQPDWLQQFLAGGLAHEDSESDISLLSKWLEDENLPLVPNWYKLALAVLPMVSLSLVVAYFAGYISFLVLLPVLIVNGLILNSAQPQAKNTFQNTHQGIKILKAYGALIRTIEEAQFRTPLLNKLQEPFLNKSYRASRAVQQLKDILGRIETRQNLFYWTFNIIFLLDLIWLLQAASWKSKYQSFVLQWFEAISHYELISSLALNRFAHPQWTVPELSASPYLYQAKDLGHPLLAAHERVKNNFELTGQGSVAVLTGSNMSGKSTFLRTIGINAVLGFMGGACCASQLQLGAFNIFSSMRTTDSLEQHVSSFYAELQRLNQLISSLKEGYATLFLLDEILKGTNSADRHKGANALIRQLHEASAFGLVSTHDLELGKLAQQVTGILNFSFNSKLIDGKLVFDYLLTKGVCDSFNASELMAQMGIAIEKAQDS